VGQLTELRTAQNEVEALIEKIAADRSTAVSDTFNQIRVRFVDTLRQLDPEASGDLEMNGEAVALKAGFGGQEQTLVTELSYGQKTLLSLTLIFAIQLVLPAPFYLFDEVDADLDEKYRSSVATLIRCRSEGSDGTGGQVIFTTFRPELLKDVDKILEVSARDGRSSVRETTEAEALALLGGNPGHRATQVPLTGGGAGSDFRGSS
jgi:structural maintenance of chromosome 3 (chondroitin sulfate proteoglycan 6)